MGVRPSKTELGERQNFRIDLSTKFGKEIPSRNLHEKQVGTETLGSGYPGKPNFLRDMIGKDQNGLHKRGIHDQGDF